jgi:hypothetical protein
MWAVMKSPLVLSTNLSSMGPQTLAVATNKVALLVNQDRLAAQARRIKSAPPTASHAHDMARRNERDVVAVAALCNSSRRTQRWLWAQAADARAAVSGSNPSIFPENGTLYTIDEDGWAWCLAMPYSGIWSVVPYNPGNHSPCLDNGEASSWHAKPMGEDEFAFIWRTGNRPYGFSWGQDPGSSGPLPHTRWLQSNNGGTWVGDLAAATKAGSRGVPFSPGEPLVIDDDGVGGISMRPGADFCLDIVGGGNVETWAGPLSGGKSVAAVLNRSPRAQRAVVRFAEVTNTSAAKVAVRSAWGEAGTHHGDSYSCTVPAHGAALLVLELT